MLMKKKILLINPYLNTLGGGEKHTLSILLAAEQFGWESYIAWEDSSIVELIKDRFDFSFNKESIISYYSKSFLSRLLLTFKFDVIVYVHDGSYFFSLAKKNIIFSMYPKIELYKNTFINSFKLSNWIYVSNSNYTKKYIDKWTNKKSYLLQPSIFNYGEKRQKKEFIILSIGRFFKHLHSKRQDLLIDVFNRFRKGSEYGKKYKLILVGGATEEDEKYVEELRNKSKRIGNVEIYTNISNEKLKDLMSRSQIYWHATGLGTKKSDLSSVEHFGMAPLEAMSAGCCVFCVRAGEMGDLLAGDKYGFLYDNQEELLRKTIQIVNDPSKLIKVTESGKKWVKDNFGFEIFKDRVKEILE